MSQYYSISPQLYDDQFWWKKDDIEFWNQQILSSNKQTSVLELAAGTGRLAYSLIRGGVKYEGLELSNQFVDYANIKLKTDFNYSPIIQGDMRNFNLHKKYDYIFIGFNSFLHLFNNNDVENCLLSIKKHMHSQTLFYLDVFVPDPLFLYRSNKLKMPIMEFYNSTTNQECIIQEILDYNSENEIANIHWLYLDNMQNCFNEFKFKMKIFYPDSLVSFLTENGFSIQNIWGSYDLEIFSEDSSLQIYQCKLLS